MNEEGEKEDFVERENRKNIFILQTMEPYKGEDYVHCSYVENQEFGECEPKNKVDIYNEASLTNGESNTGGGGGGGSGGGSWGDEEDDDDDEDYYDDDDNSEDDFDTTNEDEDAAKEDDELDEVAEEFEFDDLNDENEHWYNGPRNGQYKWHSFSETDKTKGEYVWEPEKSTENYWGNRKKMEEWIPQETKPKKNTKKKKKWIPRLIAGKESEKTVWYYKLPSTTKDGKRQADSLKHIPKLIKGKGSNSWFSQIVSTKDKTKKTIWYCKLTPLDTEKQENGEDSNSSLNAQMQELNNAQLVKPKTFKGNPEKAEVVENQTKEISRDIPQNYAQPEKTSQQGPFEGFNGSECSGNSLTDIEIQTLRMDETLSKIEETRLEMKRPTSPIPEDAIPKMIEVQIWNSNQMAEGKVTKQKARSGQKSKSRNPQNKRTLQMNTENNTSIEIDDCLFQLPEMTMSLIAEEQPKVPTAIWYEDI